MKCVLEAELCEADWLARHYGLVESSPPAFSSVELTLKGSQGTSGKDGNSEILRTRKEITNELATNRHHQKKTPPASMSMIEPRLRDSYKNFYKESYFVPSALDLKTKELIAIACSLLAKCEGCIEGHLKKAVKIGCTKEEISDAIVIAIGIASASVMDSADRAAINLDLHHFE